MLSCVSLLLGAFSAAHAAPPPRSLGGRRFLLPARVSHPFTAAHVSFRQGGGLVALPDAGDPDETMRMIGAVQRITGTVPVRPKIGIRGSFSGQVTTGVDENSALYAGARAGLDWELDGTFVVLGRPSLRLSVNPGFFGSAGTQVEPATMVASAMRYNAEALAQQRRPPTVGELTEGLLVPTKTFGLGTAVALAWRVGPRTGLIASVRGRGGYAEAQGVAGLPVSYSAGLSADWRLAENHPLVGQVEYRFRNVHDASVDAEAPLEDRLESRHLGGLGLFWRTKHEAELGLAGWSLLRFSRSDERLVVGEAVLRVFF